MDLPHVYFLDDPVGLERDHAQEQYLRHRAPLLLYREAALRANTRLSRAEKAEIYREAAAYYGLGRSFPNPFGTPIEHRSR